MRNILFWAVLGFHGIVWSATQHAGPAQQTSVESPASAAETKCVDLANALVHSPTFAEIAKLMGEPARFNTAATLPEYYKHAAKVMQNPTILHLASVSSAERAAWLTSAESLFGGMDWTENCKKSLRRLQSKQYSFASLLAESFRGPQLTAKAAAYDSLLREQYDITYEARLQQAFENLDVHSVQAPANLTEEEITAIYSYTLGDYRPLNAALRSQDPNQVMRFKPFESLISSGLKKLPPYRGPVTRVELNLPPDVLKNYVVGAEIPSPAFTSTTQGTVTRNEGAPVVLFINASVGKGRSIEKLSFWADQEKEILFPPGTHFRVKSVQSVAAENPEDKPQVRIELDELP